MAITAAFVLAATITAERAGPLVGGLVATLPVSAGPVYVFLALDHDAQFISQSAVASLAVNAANVIFAVAYCVLAQRRSLAISLGGTYVVWIVLTAIITASYWALGPALLINVAVIALGMWVVRPFRHTRMPRQQPRWYDYALRALMVAVLVGIVVTFSFRIGSYGSGLLAVFPVVLTSIILILHRRAGETTAAAANTPLGLLGFGIACMVLHRPPSPWVSWRPFAGPGDLNQLEPCGSGGAAARSRGLTYVPVSVRIAAEDRDDRLDRGDGFSHCGA
jgi:hypothetical protein